MMEQNHPDENKITELPEDDLDRVQGGYKKIDGIDRKAEKHTKLQEDPKRSDKSIMASAGNGSI